jgi:hypothetical protein
LVVVFPQDLSISGHLESDASTQPSRYPAGARRFVLREPRSLAELIEALREPGKLADLSE